MSALPLRPFDLLRATLAHLNTLPRAGEQSPLGRWLAMAVEVAESRGYAGPYRRALEVISGAEYRSTDDLDADSSRFPRIGKVPEGMLTVGFLSQGLAAAASICRIKVYLYRDGQRQRFEDGSPAFTLATGWLATPSLLVTAWHALAGNDRRPELADMRDQAANLACEFDFEKDVETGVVIRGAKLLAWDAEADIVLIRLEFEAERPGLRLCLAESGAAGPDDRLSLIHHGYATRKLLGLRGRRFAFADLPAEDSLPSHLRLEDRLFYDLPSGAGSSGAPLFDDDWRLVGQHLGFLMFPPSPTRPHRYGFGVGLDALRRFLAGQGTTTDDPSLARNALDEIQAASE